MICIKQPLSVLSLIIPWSSNLKVYSQRPFYFVLNITWNHLQAVWTENFRIFFIGNILNVLYITKYFMIVFGVCMLWTVNQMD